MGHGWLRKKFKRLPYIKVRKSVLQSPRKGTTYVVALVICV